MGLSRNKVAVPEGAAGTPPFWRVRLLVDLVDKYLSIHVHKLTVIKKIKEPLVRFLLVLTDTVLRIRERKSGMNSRNDFFQLSPIAQLVRAPH